MDGVEDLIDVVGIDESDGSSLIRFDAIDFVCSPGDCSCVAGPGFLYCSKVSGCLSSAAEEENNSDSNLKRCLPQMKRMWRMRMRCSASGGGLG